MAETSNDLLINEGQSSGRQDATGHGGGVRFIRARFDRSSLLFGTAVVLAILFLLCDGASVQAETMYLCRDRSGALNFTNVQNGSDCKTFTLKVGGGGNFPGISTDYGDNTIRYDREIRRVGTLYNVDPSLIKAIIHTESYFDSSAVSRAGAQGLMQLMPGTARDLQVVNPFDPKENIDGGTRYFRSLLDSFNDDLILSLAAYNAGPALVARTGGVPRIPETLQYINKVLKVYKVYKATW
jgi:hypothetical protein